MESVEDESEAKKFCGKCKKLVPVKDFHKAKHTKDGLRHTCRHCLKTVSYTHLTLPTILLV